MVSWLRRLLGMKERVEAPRQLADNVTWTAPIYRCECGWRGWAERAKDSPQGLRCPVCSSLV